MNVAPLDPRISDTDLKPRRRYTPHQRKARQLAERAGERQSSWERDLRRGHRRATHAWLTELCPLLAGGAAEGAVADDAPATRSERLQGMIDEARVVGHGRSFRAPPTLRERIATSLACRVDGAGERFFRIRKPVFIRGSSDDFCEVLRAQYPNYFEWYEVWARIESAIFGPWEPDGPPAVIPWRHPDIARLVAGRPDLSAALIRWVRRSCAYFEARKSDGAFARFLAQACRDRGPCGQRLALTIGALLEPVGSQHHHQDRGAYFYKWVAPRRELLARLLDVRPALRTEVEAWVAHAHAARPPRRHAEPLGPFLA
jgi:hypothetical protein